ncbi:MULTISPECIES: GTP pyrophosphokinase family protein [Corynebacterium]|uniref:GTP pyrophosphokinase n=1 Tax=Corynebacterium TaxID=1716 RepID=UPI00211C7D2C|nr:GTP pyrophosphokinase family protein [Corynebacterium phoceense]MCQ9340313.1 GTP pyrophosphokinase family protein [Corynebacterium phoceense]MCQ9347012.1 GTP pyrophosphokinase family protein [Corynebacterium phoceense]
MPEHAISQLGNRYHEWVRTHPNAATEFSEAIEDVLDDAGVVYDRVATRVKGWPSLKKKAKKRDADGAPTYPDPWNDIHDLVGARVTVFNSTVIPQAIDILGRSFTVLRSVDKAAETRISGSFGYGSHHLVLQVNDSLEELAEYEGFTFEVQIRTVLQHAWAEFEHDIRYKQGPKPPTPQVDRLFTLAAGLIELADQKFDDIAALMEVGPAPQDSVEINAETLPGVLAVILGDAFPRSRSEHIRFLAELLEANNIDTLAKLEALLNERDIIRVREAMRYRYKPGQVRLIDDLLLLHFGKEHIEATAELGDRGDRRKRLNRRLKQLRG